MPEEHAKLSPSAAETWFNCPGSAALSVGMPNRSSAFADEGTLAHAVAEATLTGKHVPPHTPEMADALRVYICHIRELSIGRKLAIETRVEVCPEVWGTADAIAWCEGTKTLYVRDLKYGAGIPVSVSNNLQLKIYALASLLTTGHPAEKIDVGIVQPRFNHEDGPIRSKEYDAADLLDFYADLTAAVKHVNTACIAPAKSRTDGWIEAYLNPTEKGCRWCLAAPICPKLSKLATEGAKKVFSKDAYDSEELSKTLDFLPILEGWIKSTREFAYNEAEAGKVCPNYKLVDKRANRKWIDETDAGMALVAAGVKCYAPLELLSPAAVEKMLPKDKKDLLDGLTFKESSGHTLIHVNDKREAIRIDAVSAFK